MKTYGLFGLLVAAGLAAQPKDCSVNVYLVPAVVMPPGMLLSARLSAAAQFAEIGVPIRIRLGLPPRDPNDSCRAPIRIRMEPKTEDHVRPGALAYALPYQESGASIHVFLDRILLNRRQPAANALLAHVMVHEIAHVLEKIDRHSAQGVMKAHWSAVDFENMENHHLRFDPADVLLIRLGLTAEVETALASAAERN